jgi:hypothetical protein
MIPEELDPITSFLREKKKPLSPEAQQKLTWRNQFRARYNKKESMRTIVLDYETKWSSKDYTLSKMSGIEYIRDPRFKAFGLCYKDLGDPNPATWVSHADIPAWVASVDWANTAVIAHNFSFDGSILAWRYGAVPAVIMDTLSMARALRGVDAGGSLAKLAEHYKLPPKGRAVHSTDGLEELTPAIEQELAEYCQHDVYLCEQIFLRFMAEGFPKKELKLIDMTMRMLVQPVLELDADVLEAHLHDVKHKKANLLMEAGVDPSELSSNPKFAALLERNGVACPMKISPTTGKETWALAKTDEGLKALAEHPNLTIQALVAARLGTKSTLEETRTETFIRIAQGKLPIPLAYWGARTGRWSGCFVAETEVLVYDPRIGPCTKTITAVMPDDLVWDGEAYVQHGGVQFSGYKEVITYDGLTGTPEHQVFITKDITCSLAEAKSRGARVMVAGQPNRGAMDAAAALHTRLGR